MGLGRRGALGDTLWRTRSYIDHSLKCVCRVLTNLSMCRAVVICHPALVCACQSCADACVGICRGWLLLNLYEQSKCQPDVVSPRLLTLACKCLLRRSWLAAAPAGQQGSHFYIRASRGRTFYTLLHTSQQRPELQVKDKKKQSQWDAVSTPVHSSFLLRLLLKPQISSCDNSQAVILKAELNHKHLSQIPRVLLSAEPQILVVSCGVFRKNSWWSTCLFVSSTDSLSISWQQIYVVEDGST